MNRNMQLSLIHLPEVRSTNTWMLDALAQGAHLPEGTVAYTLRQSAGRGQVGNGWESEFDRNIAFSMLLCPEFLPVREQFVISELCSLAIVEGIESLASRLGVSPAALNLSVKWPNDVYAGDLKLVGILIENRLMGSCFSHCVLGVGINVNQEHWIGNAPNPVSLRMLGLETDPVSVLAEVVGRIRDLYQELSDNTDGAAAIHRRYVQRLYRRSGFFPYYDPERQEHFEAAIAGVDPQGPLLLQLASGEERKYWFKEVRFVLPCGVTKE